MQHQFRLRRIDRGIAVGRITLLGTLLATLVATTAQAGTPYRCSCNGESKRFIASTYACEVERYKGSGRDVRSGGRLLVPRCTAPQFRAWNRRACANQSCTLVPR